MRIFYGPQDIVAAAGTVRQGLNLGGEHVKELLDLVPRLIDIVDRVDRVLTRVEEVVEKTNAVVVAAEVTRENVDAVSLEAASLVERGEVMLLESEKVVNKGLPLADEIISNVDPNEVAAINQMIDRMPVFFDQIDQMAPDVSHMLDAMTDLSHAVQGIPGLSGMVRRGERKRADEEAAKHPQSSQAGAGSPPPQSGDHD